MNYKKLRDYRTFTIYLPEAYLDYIEREAFPRSEFIRDAIFLFLQKEKNLLEVLYENHHGESPQTTHQTVRTTPKLPKCERSDSGRSQRAYYEDEQIIRIGNRTFTKVIKN